VISAILFDLDNTLIDFLRMKVKAIGAAAEALKKEGIETSTKELTDFYFKNGIESNTAFTNFLKTKGKYTKRTLAAAVEAYLKEKENFLEPYPEVIPTLTELKKRYRLGIVTDAPEQKALYRLSKMGITGFFELIVTFEDSGARKPSPLPFAKAIELLKLPPSEILFVGDSPSRDIKGAREVGMRTALALYGCTERVLYKPDYELQSIKDLRIILGDR